MQVTTPVVQDITAEDVRGAVLATAHDTQTFSPLVHEALRHFPELTPTAQTVQRADRIARALHEAREHRIMTAPATATAIREASDDDWAWRMLLQGRDHLRLLLRRQDGSEAAWEAAPGTTGHAGFDTLLAALAAHEFNAVGGTPPDWTEVEPLADPWIPEHPFLNRDEIIDQTPEYLSPLNVFVPARDLVTA